MTLLFLILLGVSGSSAFTQVFSGATAYSSGFDDFLYDLKVSDGKEYYLIRSKLMTYPETVYGSFLHMPYLSINPKYLGAEFSGLKVESDPEDNAFVAGISRPKLIGDTTMFLSKIDKYGAHAWSATFPKVGDTVDLFKNESGFFFVHDKHFLYKVNQAGNTIWQTGLGGSILPAGEGFFNFQGIKVDAPFMLNGDYCDTMLFRKAGSNGQVTGSMTLIAGLEPNTLMTMNMHERLMGDRIYVSGQFWGRVDFDPSAAEAVFTNYETIVFPHFIYPRLHCFLAVYDTNGNLITACSNQKFPDIQHFCTDSAGAVYIAGSVSGPTNFMLLPGDSLLITPGSSDRSFIAKYSHDLQLIWTRLLTGDIRYMDAGYASGYGMQLLTLAGDFNGTINLDLSHPAEVTFTSEGWDVFIGNYIFLDSNISLLHVNGPVEQQDIRVYPNPSTGIFSIEFPGSFRDFSLSITDIRGNALLSREYTVNRHKETLDLSGFSDGFYVIRIKTPDRIILRKILIRK